MLISSSYSSLPSVAISFHSSPICLAFLYNRMSFSQPPLFFSPWSYLNDCQRFDPAPRQNRMTLHTSWLRFDHVLLPVFGEVKVYSTLIAVWILIYNPPPHTHPKKRRKLRGIWIAEIQFASFNSMGKLLCLFSFVKTLSPVDDVVRKTSVWLRQRFRNTFKMIFPHH